jgi:hypothetical protein
MPGSERTRDLTTTTRSHTSATERHAVARGQDPLRRRRVFAPHQIPPEPRQAPDLPGAAVAAERPTVERRAIRRPRCVVASLGPSAHSLLSAPGPRPSTPTLVQPGIRVPQERRRRTCCSYLRRRDVFRAPVDGAVDDSGTGANLPSASKPHRTSPVAGSRAAHDPPVVVCPARERTTVSAAARNPGDRHRGAGNCPTGVAPGRPRCWTRRAAGLHRPEGIHVLLEHLGAAAGEPEAASAEPAGADQAGLVGVHDQLRPVAGAELHHRPADVGLRRGRAEE